jgi:hypothetical protein
LIVLEDRELVILTPPHTASRHLHMALCGPPHNGRWICGPNPAGFWDHHVVVVPSEWQRYRRYLVVRNPLTRLVGLWLHYSWAAKQPEQPMLRRDLTWPQFVLACAEDHPGMLRWFYRWTITRLIEPVDRLDVTIRYERLVDDLRSVLEADVDLSAAYHDPVDPAEWYGDDRIRDLASAWGQADRLRFGY